MADLKTTKTVDRSTASIAWESGHRPRPSAALTFPSRPSSSVGASAASQPASQRVNGPLPGVIEKD
ncbi:hypothetical protein OIDMADRAFT_17005 [Oidiodendron maius Zn]|uniref:Uncharacterized protein n=1 Tax=Oidiodendron maius (strain Zn) TaxID=913774 RepID=A0A0C3HS05_OIDMZ|nr:hypothetical protein OIDMADRAFT_17005 [Oidiodendron maius Zn]